MFWKSQIHLFILWGITIWIFFIWPIVRNGLSWLISKTSKPISDETRFSEFEEEVRRAKFNQAWRNAQRQRERAWSNQQHHQKGDRSPSPETFKKSERETFLEVLGLGASATRSDIRGAYRKMAKRYHPDRFASAKHSKAKQDAVRERMQSINEAYDWLSKNRA